MKKLLIIATLLIPIFDCAGLNVWHSEVSAQYNPSNPSEPYSKYKLTVASDPADYGYVSGEGKYMEGTSVYISTSARATDFQFKYWTKNGDWYSDNTSFYYTMTPERVDFVAHYEYVPVNPSEPALILKNRLYLQSSPDGCCSFNRTSGEKFLVDNYVSVTAYPNQGYVFQGWYESGVKVSDSQSFNYLMQGSKDVTLTARFSYNPSSPGEPASEGGNIQDKKEGDIDENTVINVTDAVILLNHFIAGTTSELDSSVADVNKDGSVNVSDAVAIIQTYLNGE